MQVAAFGGVSVGWHHSICQVASGKWQDIFLWLSYVINTTGSTRPSVFAWHPVNRYICLLAFNVWTMRSRGKELVFEGAGFCLHRFGWWFYVTVNVGLMCPGCLVFVCFIDESRKLFCLGRWTNGSQRRGTWLLNISNLFVLYIYLYELYDTAH